MPVRSEQQRKFMYAAKEGKIPGVPRSVGEEFIAATPPGAKLPAKVERSLAGRRKKGRAK